MTHYESTRPTIIEQLKRRSAYMRTTEVMELLDVTRGTLCRWVREGAIAAIRIGKDNKFDPAAIIRFLEARSV